MIVDFIFENSAKGKRIAGGVDVKYPTTDLSWIDFLNKKVMIRTTKGDFFFKVVDIDISFSIAGFMNIGLTIENNLEANAINKGDKVFKIVTEN